MRSNEVTERFLREVVTIFVVAVFSIALLLILRPWTYFLDEPVPIVTDSTTPTPLQR